MNQCRITIHRENCSEPNQTYTVPVGIRLDKAIAQAGFDLRMHCGGSGVCGKCRIVVGGQKVLACQTMVESDLDILIPESSFRTSEQHVFIPTGLPASAKTTSHRTDHRFGVAVDIGTTTLAVELHDFTGILPVQTAAGVNPQRQFGDDVMTRIHKVMENLSALTAMQQLIVEAVNKMIAELAEKNSITPRDISIVIVAGNTVMQLLFFGVDPSPLGESPFRAPLETFPPQQGSELGLKMSAGGTVEALPVFGGFVGGDIVAGALTLPLMQSEFTRFLLDIGTNGEIVLAHGGELFTAATAAGPAFEGAGIEYGTLAVPGAIDHVEIVSGKINVSTIGHEPAIGLCGSGLIDAAAVLLEHGIILPGGRFANKQSALELVSAAESGTGEPIMLTQRDVRELQLAAGAIRAGITLLFQENNVLPETIETFYVSGGFGQSIRLASARRIGLLPNLPTERFQFCGNTSLAGARAMLLNPDNEIIVRQLVKCSHHCELATLPRFQQVFAESMHWD